MTPQLGIIHNLDSKGCPSRPNRTTLPRSVRKETQRYVEDRQRRRDGCRTLADFPQQQIALATLLLVLCVKIAHV